MLITKRMPKVSLKQALLWICVGLWFIASSSLVLAMNTYTTKSFDHDMRLSLAMMSLDFEKEFVAAISKVRPLKSETIVHISAGDACFCENLVRAHINELNSLSAAHNIDIVQIDLSSTSSKIAQYIPSTPAVAVIDADGKLLFLGPYSQGSGCFSRSGEVNDIVSQQLIMPASKAPKASKVSHSDQALIISEASGCYCNQG